MARRFLGLKRAEWWFWLKWVLGNAVAWALGLAAVVLGWVAILGLAAAEVGVAESMGVAVGMFGLTGAITGTAQWLVLRKQVQRSGFWVLASAAGWAVGWGLAMAGLLVEMGLAEVGGWVEAVAMVVDAGLLTSIGAIIGTAQWLILRKRVHRSGWWVLASAAGLAVGLVAGGVGLVVEVRPAAYWAAAVGWVVPGAVYAAVTGVALVLLLRPPIRPGTPAPDACSSTLPP